MDHRQDGSSMLAADSPRRTAQLCPGIWRGGCFGESWYKRRHPTTPRVEAEVCRFTRHDVEATPHGEDITAKSRLFKAHHATTKDNWFAARPHVLGTENTGKSMPRSPTCRLWTRDCHSYLPEVVAKA